MTRRVSADRAAGEIVLNIKLLLSNRRRPVSIGEFRLTGVSGVPDLAPMKTRDGRFGYEAAGDPALPPLVFLHGIGGAARAWRG